MNQQDAAHAWWSRLRHQGLLLSPVVMLERFPSVPEKAPFHVTLKLRNAYNRFVSTASVRQDAPELEQPAILGWVDALLEHYIGFNTRRITRQHNIPEKITAVVRFGSRSDTIRPHRVLFADEEGQLPALLVMADTSPQVGRGRGRTAYGRFLELLRGTGHRLGLLTNGHQFRLVYAGLDFESWCEWESDRWFDDGEGTEELSGLRQLLSPASLQPVKEGVSGLLDAVEESRKRQADLSSVLRENVRQAVELLLEEVSAGNRTNENLFASLMAASSDRPLTDAEAHEALLQATVRVVMRLVVCLFAESRQLLPVNDPIYARAYGVRSLYELLEEAVRNEGGTHGLLNRNMAWPRLMALCRLIHGGSAHGAFPLMAYGGALFRPGDEQSSEPVARALHVLEHGISVCDAVIYHVLRKLLRGLLPVLRGKAKTFVEGPVDYTDLRSEFIGLIYEGLLDYRLKRSDEKIGPQVFLNLGREPVLPLDRLEEMLKNDKKSLKDLLTTLRKEQVTASAAAEEEEAEEDTENRPEEANEAAAEEPVVEAEPTPVDEELRGRDYLDAADAAKRWAKDAVLLAGLVNKQTRRETDSEYQARIETEANRLISRVVAVGEYYLVRAGNTRKGTGTFYTRPQLAVPTVHRTLEPLCYESRQVADSRPPIRIPKEPEAILGLKVCDPACGSASFLVAALHYLTDVLYKSLCFHRHLDDSQQTKRLTLPYGRKRTNKENEELVPFPPDDPQRGHTFEDRIKALLRRHVVERCIYGVDINPLAVELARVSLWVETLDPELPFSFLDHKIKVGNSLVGCWLDRVLDYPLKAWEREGGDGKDGPRTQRIETFLKGEKIGNRRTGDGRVKREMRQIIESRFQGIHSLFEDTKATPESVVDQERTEYEWLHDLPVDDPDERERHYRERVENSPSLTALKRAMDEWCAVWFWPTDEVSLTHAPTPATFHENTPARAAIIEQVAADMRLLHWELAFPDVFTPQRSGFDAMIGNPPWDVTKPNSQEFFTEFDPLYRTYDKQAALRKQKELFATVPQVDELWGEYNARFKALGNWARNAADPYDVTLARGREGNSLKSVWQRHRQGRVGFADSRHPFRLQGSADLNLYKMFAEVFWNLLRDDGRLGVILPIGICSDFGTKELRETLLFQCRLDFLYAFQNEKRVFAAAHHWSKQAVVLATRAGQTQRFVARFRMGVGDSPEAQDIPDDLLGPQDNAMCFTPDDVKLNSPRTLSLVELKTQYDLEIFRKIYAHSIRIGDNAPGWEINYSREFDMTNDSKHFPALEKWEAKGYRPDPFGRWIGSAFDVALPLYQGAMVHHFNPSFQQFVSGGGRVNEWMRSGTDDLQFRAKYLIGREKAQSLAPHSLQLRFAFRDITNNTNERSLIGSLIPGFPCGNTLPVLTFSPGKLVEPLLLASATSSLVCDYAARARLNGTHMNYFVLQEIPIPYSKERGRTELQVAFNAARLTFLHRVFAPDWLRLKDCFPDLIAKEWKHWWAVTVADRLRIRVEIEALVADLYGLAPDDLDWIVRDDPKDPKGFYRVDRHLPFGERLTGLAAIAFRALKAGKWSAESAANLSNDEFFALIGLPEMTTGPDPVIRKRDGCHRWQPEEFGPDDPRHGWTWDDCWKDAVTLLGSEKAVSEYVESKHEQPTEESEENGPTDLFGEPLPPKQGSLF